MTIIGFKIKRLIILSAIIFTCQAQAEIYKCKDDYGIISYQDTPCTKGMMGKLNKAQEASEEDQIRARNQLNRMNEHSRKVDAIRELEWKQRQEEIKRAEERETFARQQAAERARQYLKEQEAKERERQNQQLLERQAIAAERAARAAEQANRRQLNCRSNYTGGLVCD